MRWGKGIYASCGIPGVPVTRPKSAYGLTALQRGREAAILFLRIALEQFFLGDHRIVLAAINCCTGPSTIKKLGKQPSRGRRPAQTRAETAFLKTDDSN